MCRAWRFLLGLITGLCSLAAADTVPAASPGEVIQRWVDGAGGQAKLRSVRAVRSTWLERRGFNDEVLHTMHCGAPAYFRLDLFGEDSRVILATNGLRSWSLEIPRRAGDSAQQALLHTAPEELVELARWSWRILPLEALLEERRIEEIPTPADALRGRWFLISDRRGGLFRLAFDPVTGEWIAWSMVEGSDDTEYRIKQTTRIDGIKVPIRIENWLGGKLVLELCLVEYAVLAELDTRLFDPPTPKPAMPEKPAT